MRINSTLYVHCLSPSSRITALEVIILCLGLLFHGPTVPSGSGPPHYRGFAITFSWAHYWEGFLWASDQPDTKTSTRSARYIHKRQTSMPPAGFEPAVPKRERPQTQVIVCAATRIGKRRIYSSKFKKNQRWPFQHSAKITEVLYCSWVLRTCIKMYI